MAASAYGSLVSLLNTMDHIQIDPYLPTFFDKYQFESIGEKVDFFLDFMEKYSDADSEEANDLVRRIGAAAHEAEHVIEVEAAVRVGSGSTTTSGGSTCKSKSVTFFLKRQRIIEDMNSIKEKVIEFKEETGLLINSMPPPSSSSSAAAAAAAAAVPLATRKKTSMVGFEGYLKELLDKLIGHDSGLRILPIVGMGGIGKTTLAKNVYQDSATVHYFDFRAWVSVSQQYNATEILLQALSCLGGSKTKMDKSDDELGGELRKILFGRRYLVVLDDVWSVEAWEKIKFYFPENGNGSRIVVTTREQQLVDHFSSSALALGFLDAEISWGLFCEKTFSQEGCPTELEEIGKKIVKKCKGLPLAISVVGGLLGKSPRTREYWEKIAQDKSLVLEYSGEGNTPSSILYMSYKNLPVWLKPCFLYLGLFPEDHQINVSQLVKLLIAEGYIKPNSNQSLEEVAESYIKELVDRNLLLVGHLRRNKKLKTCCLHDLVRDLCIKIAEKEDFYCVQKDINGTLHFAVDKISERVYDPESHTSSESTSFIRHLVLNGQSAAPCKSRLLRVLVYYGVFRLQAKLVDNEDLVDPPFQQVNLRFLLMKNLDSFPWRCILSSLCWSLQTLILKDHYEVVLPPEIWRMQQLRHIKIPGMQLPDPPTGEGDDVIVLHNLQTLNTVEGLIFSDEVCKRIPNVKELKIIYIILPKSEQGLASSSSYHLHHLPSVGCLDKLEMLQYCCTWENGCDDPLQNLKLPSSLKELTLWDCKLVESNMSMIASLPHLQILELRGAVVGAEWNCFDDKFRCLKYLRIKNLEDLTKWIADSSNFPVLETLYLGSLYKLDEIPSGIGYIPTLEIINVFSCSESATMSAIKILEEQQDLGNESLRLQLPPRATYYEQALLGKIHQHSSSRNINNLTKKKSRENHKRIQQHSSLLDDTASSPFLDFCNKTRSQTSVENVVEYSQGYSTTQFEVRPPYQEEHYDFFQSGNQLQQQNQWFEGKRW